MTTKIIFICINLLLIYNSNGFIVDDYAAARQNVKEVEEQETFKDLKSHLAVIEITYETGKKLVNGYVTENSVSILNDFLPKDIRLSRIRYIYNNNLIILSDVKYEKKTHCLEYFFSIASSNKKDIKKIDSNIFLNISFIGNMTGNINFFTKNELNYHLQVRKLGSVEDFLVFLNPVDKTFKFNSIELSDKWYIFGKVNGSNQNDLIPTSYISNNFSLNILNREGYNNKVITFLSLNEEKFNKDDVGSYLLYLSQYKGVKQLKIFGQITKVRSTKDNVQILSIHKINNKEKFDISHNYRKIESRLVEDGYTLSSVSSPSSKVEEGKQQDLTQRESNDLGILQETSDELPAAKKSKPNVEDIVTELENFTCGSIITKGEYILKSRNITINVINTEAENFYSNNINGNLYLITGYYTYNSVTKSFTACHSSDDAKGHDDYLVTKEEGGKKFYPNHVLAKKH